jgi:hypothetical protein
LTAKHSQLSDTATKIILYDVLHVPTYVCNAIGHSALDGKKTISLSKDPDKGGIFATTGERLARIESNHVLYAIDVLPPRGQTFGESASKPDGNYMVTCFWDEAQLRTWKKFKRGGHKALDFDGSRLYTLAERKFLKDQYDGEYKFLRMPTLSIHKDEDREGGEGNSEGDHACSEGSGAMMLGSSARSFEVLASGEMLEILVSIFIT